MTTDRSGDRTRSERPRARDRLPPRSWNRRGGALSTRATAGRPTRNWFRDRAGPLRLLLCRQWRGALDYRIEGSAIMAGVPPPAPRRASRTPQASPPCRHGGARRAPCTARCRCRCRVRERAWCGDDDSVADRDEIVTLDPDLHDLGEAVKPAAKPLGAPVGSRLDAHPGWHRHLELRGQPGQQRLDVAFVQVLEEAADEINVFGAHGDTTIAASYPTTACPRAQRQPGIRCWCADGAPEQLTSSAPLYDGRQEPIRRGRECRGVS
jgi:hypothetical protein